MKHRLKDLGIFDPAEPFAIWLEPDPATSPEGFSDDDQVDQ
jgi:hypothetical protein